MQQTEHLNENHAAGRTLVRSRATGVPFFLRRIGSSPISSLRYLAIGLFGFAIVIGEGLGRANAADQVTRKSDNVTLRGEFTAMQADVVRIKLTSGKEEAVVVSDIKAIRFDQEPSLLSQAQSNERSGALETALQKYQQVQSELAGADKRLVSEVQFLIARTRARQALADASQLAEARKLIREFREASKSNFRYLEATLLEAALATSADDRAAGQALLQEVQSSTVKGYQLQAGVQLGRLLLLSGDLPGAKSAFDQVIQQSKGDPGSVAAQFDGMLGIALCQRQQGQVSDALVTLEEIVSRASDSETRVLAEAWIQKGDCLRQLNQPKAALMAYLHVDILYSSEPAEHAQALFRLAQLWGPAGHQDRADDAAVRLTEKYPNSTWSRQQAGGQ